MPFISIIIPTYNNEEHIEQAIESCFDSDFDDFEIIVINDASTDRTAAKLELLTEKHKGKIKTCHSEINIGPGPARNIGLEQAKGEYIMFLDGDDWLEPTAIDIIKKELLTEKPDMLMFNHQRVWPDGKKQKNIPNKYVNLTTEPKEISLPATRAGSIQNIHSCWNKAYNRTFIQKLKIEFPKGIYEDLIWSITASVKASKMYYIGKALYNYRQRNNSITKSIGSEHLMFFVQADIILSHTSKDTDFKYYQKEINNYLKNQSLGILNSGTRVPEEDKAEFLNKIHELKNQFK